MKEVRVTGGFSDTLVTTLTDKLGGLGFATVKGCLVTETGTWPPSSSPLWQPCNVDADADAATVSQVVDGTTPGATGHYYWWLWVSVGGLSMVVQVADPEHPNRPWLIYVH